MSKLSLIILMILTFVSCYNKKESIKERLDLNYPATDLTIFKSLYDKFDTISNIVTVEVSIDSISKAPIWGLNGISVNPNNLIEELHKLQRKISNNEEKIFLVKLGIHKDVKLKEYFKVRDSLRLGNLLYIAYLNSKNQKIVVRYPKHHNPKYLNRISTLLPLPPMIDEVTCFCCKYEDKYIFESTNWPPEIFNKLNDCLTKIELNEFFTTVYLEKNEYHWEGKKMKLDNISNSLYLKYVSCTNPRKFIIFVRLDSESNFESYLNLYTLCRKIYIEKWNEYLMKTYGKEYYKLNDEKKKIVRTYYPMIISLTY